jgi:hypothetical protein
VSRRARAAIATALVLGAAACGQTDGSAPGSGRPQPWPEGTPIGAPSVETVTRPGGSVVSPEGLLTVEIPADAVQGPTGITVQPVTNFAPGNVGLPAWKLEPEGTTFGRPVKLTFQVVGYADLDLLSVAWQDAQGYWVRVSPRETVRDAATRTISVWTDHFSAWTLVTGPTALDIEGTFTVNTTVDIPVEVSGLAHFTFAGAETDLEGVYHAYYLLSGTATLPGTLTVGGATCTPVAPSAPDFQLRTNIAERFGGTAAPRFEWGTSAVWQVVCGSTPMLVTMAFDNAGISYVGCTRGYAAGSTPVAGEDLAQGSYGIDCGTRGTVSSLYAFDASTCGTACDTLTPCRTAAWDCSSGTRVCADNANLPDGRECGAGQVCLAGACVACASNVDCVPPQAPCHRGTTSCATGVSVCVDSGVPVADGTTNTGCTGTQVCNGGACVGCAAGSACTPPSAPCHAGSVDCSTGSAVCVDSGSAVPDGTTTLYCTGG